MKEEQKAVRNYKDTVFRMLFSDRERLLELYNALNGTAYASPEELKVTTLGNAVYMSVKNDISFIFQSFITLYEHQSTFSPNMPLRDLIYISRQYEKYIVDESIYSSGLVTVPTPKFVVFYNGLRDKPEEMTLSLSDSYEVKVDNPDLELKVRMININPGYNGKLMETCRTLDGYCRYVERVRGYSAVMPLVEAVEQAVKECINEGILADFLKEQRAEVIAMSIFEYDEEAELKKLRASERRHGEKCGEARGIKLGENRIIMIKICKKLQKSYTISKIAEELEEPEEKIERLCRVAERYAPEYDVEKICSEVMEKYGETC